MPDPNGDFTSTLWFDGPNGRVETPCTAPDFHVDLGLPRPAGLPLGPITAGSLSDVSFTLTAPPSPEAGEWFANLRCPSCGVTFKDAAPGHAWRAGDGCRIKEPFDDDDE